MDPAQRIAQLEAAVSELTSSVAKTMKGGKSMIGVPRNSYVYKVVGARDGKILLKAVARTDTAKDATRFLLFIFRFPDHWEWDTANNMAWDNYARSFFATQNYTGAGISTELPEWGWRKLAMSNGRHWTAASVGLDHRWDAENWDWATESDKYIIVDAPYGERANKVVRVLLATLPDGIDLENVRFPPRRHYELVHGTDFVPRLFKPSELVPLIVAPPDMTPITECYYCGEVTEGNHHEPQKPFVPNYPVEGDNSSGFLCPLCAEEEDA